MRSFALLLALAAMAACAGARSASDLGAPAISMRDESTDAQSSDEDASPGEAAVGPSGDAAEPADAFNAFTSEIEVKADAGTDAPLHLTDEVPYPPGARPRAAGAVNASSDDEAVARWNHGGIEREPLPSHDAHGHSRPFHAAPRVKVDVLRVKGALAPESAEKEARSKGYWPLRLCFEEGLKRIPRLAGTLDLDLTVGADGTVRSAKRTATHLDDKDVVACVTRAMKGLTLARPSKGHPRVSVEVSLYPGDEPVYARGTGPSFDPGAWKGELLARRPELEACFRKGLATHPDLWGRLAILLAIRRDGTVKNAGETESHFPDQAVVECAASALRGASFAAAPHDFAAVYALRLWPRADVDETRARTDAGF